MLAHGTDAARRGVQQEVEVRRACQCWWYCFANGSGSAPACQVLRLQFQYISCNELLMSPCARFLPFLHLPLPSHRRCWRALHPAARARCAARPCSLCWTLCRCGAVQGCQAPAMQLYMHLQLPPHGPRRLLNRLASSPSQPCGMPCLPVCCRSGMGTLRRRRSAMSSWQVCRAAPQCGPSHRTSLAARPGLHVLSSRLSTT